MTHPVEKAFAAFGRTFIKTTGGCIVCWGKKRSCPNCHGRAWKRLRQEPGPEVERE